MHRRLLNVSSDAKDISNQILSENGIRRARRNNLAVLQYG